MSQEIVCNKGKCHDENSIENELDEITNKSNLSEEINLDLLKEMVR